MRKLLLAIFLASCTQPPLIGPKPVFVEYERPGQPPPPITPEPSPGFITLDRLEDAIVLDLQSLSSNQDRLTARYLVACDRHNQDDDLDEFEQGVNLGLNRLSAERFTSKVVPVGSADCIYRLDLDDFTLTRSEWQLIEKVTLLDFVTKTTRGQTAQFLTQTLKPYIFGVELLAMFEGDETADKGGQVYYDLVDQPDLTQDFLADQGINFQDQVDDEEALFSGFSQSKIALGKTRLITVLESDNGYCMGTFDTALGGDDLFTNPFNLELTVANNVRQSKRLFVHAAQEWICSLDNGLFGLWRLNNAADIVEVEAPANVVTNVNNAAIDPSIRIGDCNGCHYSNVAIPFSDQIAKHISNNPAFNANEKRLGQIFFRYDKVTAVIDEINRRNSAALEDLGIDAKEDPLTQTIFAPFRAEMDITQVAAFSFLPVEEFTARLRGTAISSQTLGNLLNGGTVSLATLNANFAILVDEIGLFEDIEL